MGRLLRRPRHGLRGVRPRARREGRVGGGVPDVVAGGGLLLGPAREAGQRLADDPNAEVADGAGPLDFFAPSSIYPLWTAVGAALLALGVIYGWWLTLIGFGVLAPGVTGFVFQYALREE
nr:cytochrome c oxidase subunit 4 [Kitasatospora acidiphila]